MTVFAPGRSVLAGSLPAALIVGMAGYAISVLARRSWAKHAGCDAYRTIGNLATTRSMAGTSAAIENTHRSADLVLTTAHDLSRQAVELRSSVDRFLSNVAA
jgi:hypothetical protein